jgi:hypothetical protein
VAVKERGSAKIHAMQWIIINASYNQRQGFLHLSTEPIGNVQIFWDSEGCCDYSRKIARTERRWRSEAPNMYWPHIWWLIHAVKGALIVMNVDYTLR